jgi:hypothetical protein
MVLNCEQIRNFKEEVATYAKVQVIKYLEIMWETTANKMVYNPFGIRPGYLWVTSLER